MQDLIGQTITQINTALQGFVYILGYACVKLKYINHPCRTWHPDEFVGNVPILSIRHHKMLFYDDIKHHFPPRPSLEYDPIWPILHPLLLQF